MKKRNRLRRSGALAGSVFVLAFVLISCLTMPVKAVSSNSEPVYFPLHFDTYQYGSGSSANSGSWEANTFNSDSVWDTTLIDLPLYDLFQSKDDSSLFSLFSGRSSFSLHSDADQYVTPESLQSVWINLVDLDYDQYFEFFWMLVFSFMSLQYLMTIGSFSPSLFPFLNAFVSKSPVILVSSCWTKFRNSMIVI